MSTSEASSTKSTWTHPSFLKLQIEKAKKDNLIKSRAEARTAQANTPQTRPKEQSSNNSADQVTVQEPAPPQSIYGLHSVSIIDDIVMPSDCDLSSAGFFTIASLQNKSTMKAEEIDANNGHMMNRTENMLKKYKGNYQTSPTELMSKTRGFVTPKKDLNIRDIMTVPDEIDYIKTLTNSLKSDVIDFQAVIECARAPQNTPEYTNTDVKSVVSRILIDRLKTVHSASFYIPNSYDVAEDTLRRVSQGLCTEEISSENLPSISFYEKVLVSPEWVHNPLVYIGYLSALFRLANRESSTNVFIKMVHVCSIAIANIETFIQKHYSGPSNIAGDHSQIAGKREFPSNHHLGYFFALRSILLLKIGSVDIALSHLFEAVMKPGRHIMLDFVEQINAAVLMIAMLTGCLGSQTLCLSRFSVDFMTIEFPEVLTLPAYSKRAVHSILSKTQKMIESVLSFTESRVFTRAESVIRSLSLRFNLTNQTDKPDACVLYHAYMAPLNDIRFILDAQAVGAFGGVFSKNLSKSVSSEGMRALKKYLLITQILKTGDEAKARSLATDFVLSCQKQLQKESVNEVITSMLYDENVQLGKNTDEADSVAAMLILAVFEGLHKRLENAKRILNMLLFTRKTQSVPLLLLILKERTALCYTFDNPTDDFASVVTKFVEAIPKDSHLAPADATDKMLLAALGLQGPIHANAHILYCLFSWMGAMASIRSIDIEHLQLRALQCLRSCKDIMHPSIVMAMENGIAQYRKNMHTISIPTLKQ